MLLGVRELFTKYGPHVRRLVKQVEKTQSKLTKCRNQIKFISECIILGILPNGFRIPNKWDESNYRTGAILKNAGKALMKEHRSFLYKKIKLLQESEVGALIDLYGVLQNVDFKWLVGHLGRKMSAAYRKDVSRLDRKMGNLLHTCDPVSTKKPEQNVISSNISSKFVNLTNKDFGDEVTTLLNHGTNYAINNKVQLLDTIAQLNGVTKDKETVHRLVSVLDKRMEGTTSKKYQKSELSENKIILGLKSDADIKIAKADKGGKLVAMNADEYEAKMKTHVESKFKKLEVDPTKKLVAQLRLFLSKEVGWSNGQRDDLAPLYPKTPVAFGQPKLHKEGNPLRVIISQKDACFSKIGKFLVNKFNVLLEKPASNIKNGKEFLNIIRQRPIPTTSTLISLDVVDMFTNVSIEAALNALQKKFESIDDTEFEKTLLMSKAQCVKLVSLILKNNYFLYEGVVYIQEEGLAMGSPLSPLLANLVMEKLEIDIQRLYQDKIDLWFRYIDDTFIEWIGQNNELETFLAEINGLDDVLKFTMEIEKDNTLTFLDTKVTKVNGDVMTGVFKKPTAGDGIIPFESHNPLSLKLSVARQRLQRIEEYHNTGHEEYVAKCELRAELETNGYPNGVIKRMFYDRDKGRGAEAQKEERQFIPLHYDKNLERSFKEIICNDKVGIAWKQKTKILDIYKASRFPTKNQEIKNAIYVIPCSCGMVYIGETGRPVRVRIKEHMANVRLERQQSKLFLHLDNTVGHIIRWDDTFILGVETNDKKRKLKEGMFIELNKYICISDKSVELQREWDWVIQKFKVKEKFYGVELFTI